MDNLHESSALSQLAPSQQDTSAVSLKQLARDPVAQLALIVLSSLAIYTFAFVQPYSLLKWWATPLTTLAKMSKFETRAGATYILAIAALFLLYWFATRITLAHPRAELLTLIVGGALAFNVVMLFLYPVDAADIFDYIALGRLQSVHSANPYYQVAGEFKDDPLVKYSAWSFSHTSYGPAWEMVSATATRFTGADVKTNVLTFKLISVLGYALTALVIALILKGRAPERLQYGVLLFLWNPLVIYTTAGNGHNDQLMVLFMVLGFYLMLRGHFTLAAMAETMGVLIKFIPILLIPVIVIAALKRLEDWKARASFLFITAGACWFLILAFFLPYWRGGDILDTSRKTSLFTTSLPTLLKVTLAPSIGEATAEAFASRVALAFLGIWILRELWLLWHRRAEQVDDAPELESYLRASVSILLFYLLVTVLWFQEWYVIWPLALVALLPDGILTRGTLLLAYAAMWKMPLFEFIFFRDTLPPVEYREWRLTPATLGLPWLYFVYHFVRAKIFRKPIGPLSVPLQPSASLEG